MTSLFTENKRLNELEFREKKCFLHSKPLTLRLILNNYCNINCVMCEIARQKNKYTIPYEAIKQSVYFFPYLERIDWQGGEVFLIDYFEKIIQEVSFYQNIHQTVQTNGLLLNEKWAELLARHNVSVLFSIDGASKKTYEYIRRGAKFERLLKNLSLFEEYRNKYNSNASKILCVCIMRSNYTELEDFIEFAIEYNFDRISLGAIHGENAVSENIFNPLDSTAIDYIKKAILQIEKICVEKEIILEYSFKPCLTDKTTNLVEGNSVKNNGKEIKCKLPWSNLCIDAIRGGDAYPECLCSKSIGNIASDSLLDIWNSPLMQQYRLAIVNDNFNHICSQYCTQIK